MKIHQVTQGSSDWLALRAGYPTSSEFSSLLTPKKLEISKSMESAYVPLKLAEKWLGHPIQSFTGFGAVDQGKVREEEARPWLALELDADIEVPGFITNDDDTAGCSPDGLIPSMGRGVEIKCPEPSTHVSYLLEGILPPDYMLQVQGSMLVTGLEEWVFLSYHPRFPKLLLIVKKDQAIHDALSKAIDLYWDRFEDGWAALVAANDGEEPVYLTEAEEWARYQERYPQEEKA